MITNRAVLVSAYTSCICSIRVLWTDTYATSTTGSEIAVLYFLYKVTYMRHMRVLYIFAVVTLSDKFM